MLQRFGTSVASALYVISLLLAAQYFKTHTYTRTKTHTLSPTSQAPQKHPPNPRYTRQDLPLLGADPVVWYSFGVTHAPRVEDFPVMPVEVGAVGGHPPTGGIAPGAGRAHRL
jgi:Cu2+-containing amine oxidase